MTRTTQTIRELLIVAVLALVIFSPALLFAQGPAGPDLVGALKATPGCLGVETARTTSGKQVIFAWFESKQALLGWIGSDPHIMLMGMAPGAASGRAPLEGIADNSGPILTIASLTYAPKPEIAGLALPVTQIAIELYAPLPGGLAVGGRFAPEAVVVPGLYVPQLPSR